MNAVVSTTTAQPSDRRSLNRAGGRLTPEDVRDVFLSTDSTTACGRRHGISGAMVSLIRNRKAWTEITRDLVRPGAVSQP